MVKGRISIHLEAAERRMVAPGRGRARGGFPKGTEGAMPACLEGPAIRNTTFSTITQGLSQEFFEKKRREA